MKKEEKITEASGNFPGMNPANPGVGNWKPVGPVAGSPVPLQPPAPDPGPSTMGGSGAGSTPITPPKAPSLPKFGVVAGSGGKKPRSK